MTITKTEKVRPDYDPYEIDCCGSHKGEHLKIEADNGKLVISIQEMDSGIGPSYTITAEGLGQKSKKLHCFLNDDGELDFYIEGL